MNIVFVGKIREGKSTFLLNISKKVKNLAGFIRIKDKIINSSFISKNSHIIFTAVSAGETNHLFMTFDHKLLDDPWGRSYVVNARYFPGNTQYSGSDRHHVYVLSAGPDHLWSTPYSDGAAEEEVTGDDIGFRICVRK